MSLLLSVIQYSVLNPFFVRVLAILIYLQPVAPWSNTYADTAHAITDVTEESSPLFAGPMGRERTIALLVSLAWFESHFNPEASGDNGMSHGLYQQQRFGELRDPHEATVVALRELRISFRICRGHPASEGLGWYAAGGDGCENERGRRLSRHRYDKAVEISFALIGAQ